MVSTAIGVSGMRATGYVGGNIDGHYICGNFRPGEPPGKSNVLHQNSISHASLSNLWQVFNLALPFGISHGMPLVFVRS